MSTTNHIFLICVCLFHVINDTWSQTQPHWRSWTSLDGLRLNFYDPITFNPSGNVLFCSPMGAVYKFDGYSLQLLPNTDARDHFYESVAEENGIWGYSDQGLVHFSNGQWETFDLKDIPKIAKPIKSYTPFGYLVSVAESRFEAFRCKFMIIAFRLISAKSELFY